jgi:hypothetical protein
MKVALNIITTLNKKNIIYYQTSEYFFLQAGGCLYSILINNIQSPPYKTLKDTLILNVGKKYEGIIQTFWSKLTLADISVNKTEVT